MTPILSGDYPDPTVLRVGEDYYMTHSGLPYARGLLIWHSRDLRAWRPVTRALRVYEGDVWAPELVCHDGVFFIYYPVEGRNKVITASDIAGPWSEPVDLEIGHIDPGHVVGQDGKRYLHLSGGHVVELTPDGLATQGPVRKVYDGWPFPADWRVEGSCLEAPKLTFKNDYYHLLSAQGGTAGPTTSHMVIHARSRSPIGPWENSPYNPIIRTVHRTEQWWSRGHASLINTSKGEWYLMYHAYENGYRTLGRQVLMEAVEWTGDGWLKVAADAPTLDPAVCEMELSDEFKEDALGVQWQSWGEYQSERYAVGGGSLRLRGQGASPGDSSPLTIVARDHGYEVAVVVECIGESEAGLMLFYNPACYAALSIGPHGVRLGLRGKMMHFHYPVESQPVRLKIVNDRNEVDFWVGTVGRALRKLPESADVSGYHHENFGGYLSLRPGLFCTGEGSAVFRRFEYHAATLS